MKKYLVFCLLFFSQFAAASTDERCSNWHTFLKPACVRLSALWNDGYHELYLSGYAWHNRLVYTPEKIQTYNELAWGGGLGKGYFDEKQNWHGIYAFAFLDSHKNLQPVAGYAYLKVAQLTEQVRAGLGFSVLMTMRPDINNGIPFPGALPWMSIFYKKTTLGATYIPGFNSNGNVLYLFLKYRFEAL